MNQQPLAALFHRFHRLSRDWRLVIEARKQRKRGAKVSHGLACKRASECTGSAKNRIAFGHRLLDLTRVRLVRWLTHGQQNAPKVHAERAGMKACIQ